MTDSIKCMTLNPKCVSLEKLYGQFDKDSYEWSDGILATIIRRFAKVNYPGHTFPNFSKLFLQ